jgi:hypothetical protein
MNSGSLALMLLEIELPCSPGGFLTAQLACLTPCQRKHVDRWSRVARLLGSVWAMSMEGGAPVVSTQTQVAK